MDPVSIASIIAMIVGGAMQHKAQSDAAKRQREQAVMAQQRQLSAQNEATAAAQRRAAQFDPNARKEQQDQIVQELTGQLTEQVNKPQITAQGVQVGTTLPAGQGGQDYLTARAKEEAKTRASLHALASLMGRVSSSSELRRREAVDIGDTAGEIGRIQSGADNIFGIDQIGVGAAGQPSLGMMVAGQALGAAGQYGMNKAALAPKGPKYPEYGMPSGPTGGWV